MSAVFDPNDSIANARETVMLMRWSDGVECPCCGQYARVYVRRLNRSMIRSLIRMYRAAGVGEAVHTPSVLGGQRGEEARLSYWELIRPAKGPRGQKRGWWEVTSRGERFLLDAIAVPSHAVMYDGELLALSGPSVNVRTVLADTGFDLTELMNTSIGPLDGTDEP